MWQAERDAPASINAASIEHGRLYQDELAYALGQLGAFDTLTDLEVPPHRKRVWMVNVVLGYLNVQECYGTNCIGFIGDPMHIADYQNLLPLLLQVLHQHLGLSAQEAASYLQGYGRDYFSE